MKRFLLFTLVIDLYSKYFGQAAHGVQPVRNIAEMCRTEVCLGTIFGESIEVQTSVTDTVYVLIIHASGLCCLS
jgi:hypothetical protein